MKQLYFIPGFLEPNSASTNRCLSFIKSFANLGVNVEMVLFEQPKDNIELPTHTHIHYSVYNSSSSRGKVVRTLHRFYSIFLFISKLRKDDNIFLYGSRDIMHWVIKKKNINVYQEVTEHPDVTGYKNPLTSVSTKTYLSDCKKLKHLFVISTSLKEFYIANGVSPERITIVNVIVDPDRFVNVEKQDEADHYIAYCGSLYNKKDGIDILIKAFSYISTKYPDKKLYIIGKTPSSYEADANENVALIKSLHLEEKVVLTGEISAAEMPQMLKNAEVLALARPENLQTKNGFPTKLGEYLLTMNPVIVTKVSDIPLFLENGVSAYLANPDDVQDFSSKLLSLYSDYELAKKVGRRGYEVAMKSFNSDTEASKIVNTLFPC